MRASVISRVADPGPVEDQPRGWRKIGQPADDADDDAS